MDGSMKVLLVQLLLAIAVVTLVVYPAGGVWVLTGITFAHCDDFFPQGNYSHAAQHAGNATNVFMIPGAAL